MLPPDINESGAAFTVAGEHIRFGLAAFKGVGRGFTDAVLAERERGGGFTSFPDFCTRLFDADLNKRYWKASLRLAPLTAWGINARKLLEAYTR
jgi:DNA polymerase-3 subunit alpha